MRVIKLHILILLVLFSCQENKKEETVTEKEIDTEITDEIIEPDFNAYCFYNLDNKHSTEKDISKIKNWLDEKSEAILNDDSIHNIFNQNGGGINGAQKNPNSDLYIAITTPNRDSTEVPKLYLNGDLYENQVYAYNPNLTWCKVDMDLWDESLKEIESNDIEIMFSEEFSNQSDYNNQSTANEDLFIGQIIKFDITFKDKKLTKYFHAAFYE